MPLRAFLGALALVCLMAGSAFAVERIRCKASYYGAAFDQKQTASGELFNRHGLTAAHPTYAFGTRLQVINPATNKSVIVRVNDRGPYIPGRCIDLSERAAVILGFLKAGVATVLIVRLREAKPHP